MDPIQLWDGNGNMLVELPEDLLRDFYDEVFIEEKSLLQTLMDYKPEAREQISKYIIHRLAMVDPGYQPGVDYDE